MSNQAGIPVVNQSANAELHLCGGLVMLSPDLQNVSWANSILRQLSILIHLVSSWLPYNSQLFFFSPTGNTTPSLFELELFRFLFISV